MYFERSLRAYRSGERRDEVMNVAASTLGDQDFADPAACFSSIVIEVEAPRAAAAAWPIG